MVNPSDCNPLKINGYGVSRSNIASNGIAELNALEKEQVFIYPNPANSSFNLVVEDNLIGKGYHLSDPTGRTIAVGSINSNKQVIYLTGLHSGTYFLYIEHCNYALKLLVD